MGRPDHGPWSAADHAEPNWSAHFIFPLNYYNGGAISKAPQVHEYDLMCGVQILYGPADARVI